MSIPGKAVQTTRSVFAYIHHKSINENSIRKSYDLVCEVPIEQLKEVDRSGLGMILYIFLGYAVRYYAKYHGLDLNEYQRKLTQHRVRRRTSHHIKQDSFRRRKDEFSDFLS